MSSQTFIFSIGDAIKNCLTKKFFTFKGRATRLEFWSFTLFQWFLVGIWIGLGVLLSSEIPSIIGSFAAIILTIPSLALCVRRMNDAGVSPWFLLLYFVPILNILVLPGLLGFSGPKEQYGIFDDEVSN